MDFEIRSPEKSTYKFNEVTSITGVKPYVLRFWESEFGQIQPAFSEDGQKFYGKDDVELIGQIKVLLFEEKMSIPEAKKHLAEELKKVEVQRVEFQRAEEQQLAASTPSSIALEEVSSTNSLSDKAMDLKDALDQIINKNSVELHAEEPDLNNIQLKAEQVVQKVTASFNADNRHYSDQDVVNLVMAKKKMSNLLGQIEDICTKHNWT